MVGATSESSPSRNPAPGAVPPLAVSRNKVVIAGTNQPIRLRGINRSGMEYDPEVDDHSLPVGDAKISYREMEEIVTEWGANIIRLPINQDWVLRGVSGLRLYLENLDKVISWASSLGAYTLLTLQWLGPYLKFGGDNGIAPLPNAESLILWEWLATRYKDEPAVLFDIYTEPHSPLPHDPNALYGIRDDESLYLITSRKLTMNVWQSMARHIIKAIRRVHPDSLIFVSGIEWGYDLRGMPLTISPDSGDLFPNLVYGTHVYPVKGPRSIAGKPEPLPGPAEGPSWYQAFGHLAQTVPVFASEWGVTGGTENETTWIKWGKDLITYLNALNIGWTAWSWADSPRIVADARKLDYAPTAYGLLVRRSLAQHS
ncbi:MAG TPA: cellulase family glycosylhydrolase [Blastocatellia bacterium]|nr:cellulase family glycosylhydrolase [Blastocatellia bacterium]